ncbi:MAG TPA: enoyl-CoA hydratase-related protein [Acidimicrobiia bacterium]|nr:enoyl-CoA hydratase-related protein [Acidimicrobiia bacterium]
MDWLQCESEKGVRWLTIDRPETKNAIPVDGWPALGDAFLDFERSDDRVLVVTGAGGDFCSGADLDPDRFAAGSSVGADLDPDRFSSGSSVVGAHRRMKVVGRAATALHTISKPTIAAVDGVAVGAGMNLAIGCDVVVATDRARFSEIFVRRGLTVDFGGTWLLPRIVGLQRAKELALSGRIVPADEALAIGLVLEVVAVDDLRDRALELATSFMAGAPIGQRFAKQGIGASFQSSFAESLSWEGQSQAIALGTEDVVEGVAAFLQKRDPDWQGR